MKQFISIRSCKGIITIMIMCCIAIYVTPIHAQYTANDQLWNGIASNNVAIVETALDTGADADSRYKDTPNMKGMTALMYACSKGNPNIVRLLISKGADVNLETREGYTALSIAIMRKQLAIAEFLIRNGANVNHSINGESLIANAHRVGDKAAAKLLSKYGAQ